MKAFVGSQICNESVALFASRPADKSLRRRRSKLDRFVDNLIFLWWWVEYQPSFTFNTIS
jgi:hypothetical protein